MRLVLTLAMLSIMSFAMQTCSKSSTAAKPDVAQANTNTMSPAPAATVEDDAPRISLEEAKKDFDANDALFIDTRAEAAYNVEHVKGAINIPAEAFQRRYAEVPKGKKIIAYCS